jgi:hypothetical protein
MAVDLMGLGADTAGITGGEPTPEGNWGLHKAA